MTYDQIHGYCDFHAFYKAMLERMPNNGVMAEVGVWLGHSVAYMATLAKESGKNITIHAVDTFEGSIEHKKRNLGNFRDQFVANIEGCAVGNFVNVIQSESVVAAKSFKDESLDFVFIDGSHDYHSVSEDIKVWRRKVKPSGILAGHDYSEAWPGVIRAVKEQFIFKKQINIERNVWWIQ